MNKQQFREQFLTYFDRRLESIVNAEKLNCYYVSGIESRELLGVIHFFWFKDYINEEEYTRLKDIVYTHITEAEKNIHHSI